MRVWLGLGTNLGEREQNIDRAIECLGALPATALLRRAPLYVSAPVGPPQPDFVNTAVEIETAISLPELLAQCKDLEVELGRRPSFHWGPRLIDIDLLLAEVTLDLPELTVPHRELHHRRFALEPLCDLIPEAVHPLLQKTLRSLLDALGDQGVRRLG